MQERARVVANPTTQLAGRFSVAPMMDWTDRHCRVFHRLLSSTAVLYTEMVTTGALLHGDVDRHLAHDAAEHPLVLQLGGSDPDELAACARLAQQYGYAAVNLNCGCPSERVQRGAFGACLMETPERVARCVDAMRAAVTLPVTVKHRIGLGRDERYEFVRDFVGVVSEAGCKQFVVHARNAWLEGLSPKQNREVPPLRYELVHRLKRDFPALQFVLNGGLREHQQARELALGLDGVMFGREAYHNPWILSAVDSFWGEETHSVPAKPAPHSTPVEAPSVPQPIPLAASAGSSRRAVAQAMADYAVGFRHLPAHAILRHLLGLYHGQPRARLWRQQLSGAQAARIGAAPELIQRALDLVDPG
jgi:tRNA-dihydrouridine synthase A